MKCLHCGNINFQDDQKHGGQKMSMIDEMKQEIRDMRYVIVLSLFALVTFSVGMALNEILFVLTWVGCIMGAFDLAVRKGRNPWGHVLITAIIWVPWLIVLAFLKPIKQCPLCRCWIHKNAILCNHCRQPINGEPMASTSTLLT